MLLITYWKLLIFAESKTEIVFVQLIANSFFINDELYFSSINYYMTSMILQATALLKFLLSRSHISCPAKDLFSFIWIIFLICHEQPHLTILVKLSKILKFFFVKCFQSIIDYTWFFILIFIHFHILLLIFRCIIFIYFLS